MSSPSFDGFGFRGHVWLIQPSVAPDLAEAERAQLQRIDELIGQGLPFQAHHLARQLFSQHPFHFAVRLRWASTLGLCAGGDQAIACLLELQRQRPHLAACWQALAWAYEEVGRYRQQHEALQQLHRLLPEDENVWLSLGCNAAYRGDAASAWQWANRADAKKPLESGHWSNFAFSLATGALYHDARLAFELGLARPEGQHLGGNRFNYGFFMLGLGELETGFAHYEARFFGQGSSWFPPEEHATADLPVRYSGQNLHGKTLLVLSEMGLGDQILAWPWIRPAQVAGARVILETHSALADLARGMDDAPEVITPSAHYPEADYHLYLFSLPRYLPPPQWQRVKPYLQARAEHFPLPPKRSLRVALAWESKRDLRNFYMWRKKSLELSQLAPLFALAGVEFYLLQAPPEASALPPNVHLCHERLSQLSHTAALLSQMDLLISVDTMFAHLAGALGTPVWVMRTTSLLWPWVLPDTPSSRWYPQARVFAQTTSWSWDGVITDISRSLEERCTAI